MLTKRDPLRELKSIETMAALVGGATMSINLPRKPALRRQDAISIVPKTPARVQLNHWHRLDSSITRLMTETGA